MATESEAKNAVTEEQPEEVTAVLPHILIYRHLVKFVCGRYEQGGIVAPGEYFTAINVHNPTGEEIRYRKRFAIGLPGEKSGPITQFFFGKLRPHHAMEIDCPDIKRHTQELWDEPFIKGFAIIESLVELEVVAVYTAAKFDPTGEWQGIQTMDIEYVPSRRASVGLPDLVPVPDPEPGIGFCRLDDQGRLLVTVQNQGAADASIPTTTRVHFAPGGTFDLPTPPIPAGASVTLPPLPIPAECYNPNCDFRITVDAETEIIESSESNNTASGSCLG